MKGLHILIEAFNSLPMSAELTIVGDLNRDPAYTHRLRGLAMHSGVKWIGPVAHDGVWAWFDWSDVVVVPSLWYENAPLVIQEALAMRRPVIASRLGSLPEWVRDDADGVLYPAGDVAALRQVLSDLANDRRRLLGWHNQIKPVRTMQSMAEEMAVVYAELIAARRARHT
jgi:glycosyltransferase involved in cell wall biosynthesis